MRARPGRRVLSLADQGFSSLTNFVAVIAMARGLDASDFGAVSALLTVAAMTIGLARGLVGEPALTRLDRHAAHPHARPLSSAVAVGGLTSVVLLAAAPFVGDRYAAGVLALALFSPLLAGQDALRFSFIAAGRPGSALLSDVTWLLAQVLFFITIDLWAELTVASAVSAWGCGGALGLLAALCLEPAAFRLESPLLWLSKTRDLGGYYVLDFLARAGAVNATLFIVVAVAGLAQAGALRGAQALFGPIRVLLWSAALAFVPTMRARLTSGESILRELRGLSSALCLSTVLVGAGLLLLPRETGEALLGDTWAAARETIMPLTVATAAAAWNGGTAVGFRVYEAARAGTGVRLVQAFLTIVAGSLGATVDGAVGAAYGLAAAALLSSVVWELRLSKLAVAR